MPIAPTLGVEFSGSENWAHGPAFRSSHSDPFPDHLAASSATLCTTVFRQPSVHGTLVSGATRQGDPGNRAPQSLRNLGVPQVQVTGRPNLLAALHDVLSLARVDGFLEQTHDALQHSVLDLAISLRLANEAHPVHVCTPSSVVASTVRVAYVYRVRLIRKANEAHPVHVCTPSSVVASTVR